MTERNRRIVTPWSILLLLGFVLQVGLACWFYDFRDPELNRLAPDDTFHYLKIASNIAQGCGSVFSAGEPTNGYHPLWMLVLVLAHLAFNPGRDVFVLIALVLSAVFSVWSAAVFRRVLMQSGFSESASTLGMALFLFSPWSLLLNLSGMETALFFLLFFSYLRTFRKVMCVRGGGDRNLGLCTARSCCRVDGTRADRQHDNRCDRVLHHPCTPWLDVPEEGSAARSFSFS